MATDDTHDEQHQLTRLAEGLKGSSRGTPDDDVAAAIVDGVRRRG
jgi:hypothetical protein